MKTLLLEISCVVAAVSDARALYRFTEIQNLFVGVLQSTTQHAV